MASSGAPIVSLSGMVRNIQTEEIPARVDTRTGEVLTPPRIVRRVHVDTGLDNRSSAFGQGGFAVVMAAASNPDLVANLATLGVGDMVEVTARAWDNLVTVREPRRDASGEKIRGTGQYRNEVTFSITEPVTVVASAPKPAAKASA